MKMQMRLGVRIFPLIALLAAGCGKKTANEQTSGRSPSDPPDKTVVAMVNSTPLTWGAMNKRAMGFLKDEVDVNHLIIPTNRMNEAKEYFRKRAINAFVFKTVMMDEAANRKVIVTDEDRQAGLRSMANILRARNWTTNDYFSKGPMDEATMHREFEDGLVIDKLLAQQIGKKIIVDPKEIMRAITMIGATNDLKRVKLEAVRKQLMGGASFEDTARAISEQPNASQGGDLGEFARGKLEKKLEDVAFSLKVGAISPIIETAQGYHLIKVTSHTHAQTATASTPAIPETVRASQILIRRIPVDRKRITETLRQAKFNADVKTYYSELRSKAKIECYLYKDMKF